mgnify:CR=1 FL=1
MQGHKQHSENLSLKLLLNFEKATSSDDQVREKTIHGGNTTTFTRPFFASLIFQVFKSLKENPHLFVVKQESTHSLKITQNVAFDFFHFLHFPQIFVLL